MPAQGHEPDVLLTSDGPYVRGGTTIRALVSRADYRELDTSPDTPEPVMFAGVPLPGVLPTTHMVGGWTAEEIAAAHQRRLDRSERWLHDTRDLVAASRNRHSAESVMTWAADHGLVLTASSGVLSVESRPTSSCDDSCATWSWRSTSPPGRSPCRWRCWPGCCAATPARREPSALRARSRRLRTGAGAAAGRSAPAIPRKSERHQAQEDGRSATPVAAGAQAGTADWSPLGRGGDPDEVAEAVAFLASPASATSPARASCSTAAPWAGGPLPLPERARAGRRARARCKSRALAKWRDARRVARRSVERLREGDYGRTSAIGVAQVARPLSAGRRRRRMARPPADGDWSAAAGGRHRLKPEVVAAAS